MAGSLQYEKTSYKLGLSTPSTRDPSDAKGDEWGKMNSKNGINIGVGSTIVLSILIFRRSILKPIRIKLPSSILSDSLKPLTKLNIANIFWECYVWKNH